MASFGGRWHRTCSYHSIRQSAGRRPGSPEHAFSRLEAGPHHGRAGRSVRLRLRLAGVGAVRVSHAGEAASRTWPPRARCRPTRWPSSRRWSAPRFTLTGTTRTGAWIWHSPNRRTARPLLRRSRLCASTAACCGRKAACRIGKRQGREGVAGGRSRAGPAPAGAPEGRRGPGLVAASAAPRHQASGPSHRRTADRQRLGAERRACRKRPRSWRAWPRTLQQDGAVQYADPVKRVFAFAAPNDPFYREQWSLNDPVSGVNAEAAWALQPNSASVSSPWSTPASCRTRTSSAACCPATTSSPTRCGRATATRATRIRATKATGNDGECGVGAATVSSTGCSSPVRSPRTRTTASASPA